MLAERLDEEARKASRWNDHPPIMRVVIVRTSTAEQHTAAVGTPNDARTAVLFKNGDAGLFAITLANNPEQLPTDCGGTWERLGTFPLGVQEIMPVDIAPESILRSLESQGYIVWPMEHTLPFGSSQ